MIPVYAVVPSYGRPCARDCFNSLINQVDALFLVQTREFPIPPHPKLVCLLWDSGREKNIHEWWNMGIKAAAVIAGGWAKWDVLVVNDDVIAPPNLATALSRGMRETTADLAWPQAAARGGMVTGWCFMLRGESGILADQQFRWWYGDNDIELQARSRGGVVAVPGCRVTHLFPCGHDYLMTEQIKADAELFRKKWEIA